MRDITQEWQWINAPTELSTPDHYAHEWLVWRGMVLACIEAFESDRFFGNIGVGLIPLDYDNRVAHVKRVGDCRQRIECNVLQLLNSL